MTQTYKMISLLDTNNNVPLEKEKAPLKLNKHKKRWFQEKK